MKISIYSDEEIKNIISEFENQNFSEGDFQVADDFTKVIEKEQEDKARIVGIIKENQRITIEELSIQSNITVKHLTWLIEELEDDKRVKREITLQV